MSRMTRESISSPPDELAFSPSVIEWISEKQFDETIHKAKILIVDDEPANLTMLREILQETGYTRIFTTQNPLDVVHLYREIQPDLILLDLIMPKLDGMGVMDLLSREDSSRGRTPILVLTADNSPLSKRQALSRGAKEFLTKPFDATEMLLRIANLLETHFLHIDLKRQNQYLEERVRERTAELETARNSIAAYTIEIEEAHVEILERLARAGEFRDDDTGQHTQRVGHTSGLIAQALGFDQKNVAWIQQASRLHDVGKIGISDLILLKPSSLTKEEFDTMKTHTTIGAEMLQGGRSELIRIAQRIAGSHHERWDGDGYPQGLKAEEIPIEARILAVADVFDALTHDRPYKKAWSVEQAVAEIRRQGGTQFDPAVVHAFLTLPHSMLV